MPSPQQNAALASHDAEIATFSPARDPGDSRLRHGATIRSKTDGRQLARAVVEGDENAAIAAAIEQLTENDPPAPPTRAQRQQQNDAALADQVQRLEAANKELESRVAALEESKK